VRELRADDLAAEGKTSEEIAAVIASGRVTVAPRAATQS
jgi:hypothetical protein